MADIRYAKCADGDPAPPVVPIRAFSGLQAVRLRYTCLGGSYVFLRIIVRGVDLSARPENAGWHCWQPLSWQSSLRLLPTIASG